MPDFYEFFAGGGMARAGLGEGWNCVFANDFDEKKASSYRANWGGDQLLVEDVNLVVAEDIPGQADLTWASFPCQDLSLAGNYGGIGHWADREQTRSGTFWPFWRLVRNLREDNRAPRLIVLENVYGTLKSNGGRDFAAISDCFSSAGYQFGAMIVDARHFLPHSRQRLFVLGVRSDIAIPSGLKADGPTDLWHPQALFNAYGQLSAEAKNNWIWWNLAPPAKMTIRFADLIQDEPEGCEWHSDTETAALLGMMNARHLGKVEAAKNVRERVVGTVYKRTRVEGGVKAQRAEVRFDDLAGCLRTPSGGSSRQSIIVVEGPRVRSRLLAPREAARLMGLPDTYKLPAKYNDAYHISGDGVALPVVRHLANNLFEPILATNGLIPVAMAAE